MRLRVPRSVLRFRCTIPALSTMTTTTTARTFQGFDPNAMSLSQHRGVNSSCPHYNYTHAQWVSAMVDRADQVSCHH